MWIYCPKYLQWFYLDDAFRWKAAYFKVKDIDPFNYENFYAPSTNGRRTRHLIKKTSTYHISRILYNYFVHVISFIHRMCVIFGPRATRIPAFGTPANISWITPRNSFSVFPISSLSDSLNAEPRTSLTDCLITRNSLNRPSKKFTGYHDIGSFLPDMTDWCS